MREDRHKTLDGPTIRFVMEQYTNAYASGVEPAQQTMWASAIVSNMNQASKTVKAIEGSSEEPSSQRADSERHARFVSTQPTGFFQPRSKI